MEPKQGAWKLASLPCPSLPHLSHSTRCDRLVDSAYQRSELPWFLSSPLPLLFSCSGNHHLSQNQWTPTTNLVCLHFVLHEAHKNDLEPMWAGGSPYSNSFKSGFNACKIWTWCVWTFTMWFLPALYFLVPYSLLTPNTLASLLHLSICSSHMNYLQSVPSWGHWISWLLSLCLSFFICSVRVMVNCMGILRIR
jgi:hypothetical protein